jgi:hypothetical protein
MEKNKKHFEEFSPRPAPSISEVRSQSSRRKKEEMSFLIFFSYFLRVLRALRGKILKSIILKL